MRTPPCETTSPVEEAPVTRSRREYLTAVAGAAMIATAGCLESETAEAGSIVVRNHSEETVAVTVVISKISRDHGATRSHDEPPESDPIWRREFSFDVANDEREVEPTAVDEPGAYYVEASAPGGTASDWLGLYSSGGDIAEDYVYVGVGENGVPTISITHGD